MGDPASESPRNRRQQVNKDQTQFVVRVWSMNNFLSDTYYGPFDSHFAANHWIDDKLCPQEMYEICSLIGPIY